MGFIQRVAKSFTPASKPIPVSMGHVTQNRSMGPPNIFSNGRTERGFVVSTPTVGTVEKILTDYMALNTILIDRIGAAVTPFDPYLLLTFADTSGYLSGGMDWKAAATVGQGYDGDPELLKHLEMANEWFTFQDVLDQWAADVEVYGNAYIEIVRTPTSANFYNMAALRTRVKPNKGSDFLSYVHYEYGLGLLVYREFDEFVPGSSSGVRHFRLKSRRGHRYYGDPEYISAKRSLVLNFDILSLAEKFFENSFLGDMAITIKGSDYTDEDIERFRQYIQATAQGLDNASKVVVFQVAPSEDVKLDKLNGEIKDAAFAGLRSDNKEEIVIANRVPPAILGIASPGKLSNTNEVREGLRVFQLGFANARQRAYEKHWQRVLADAGLPKSETFRLNKMSIAPEDVLLEGIPTGADAAPAVSGDAAAIAQSGHEGIDPSQLPEKSGSSRAMHEQIVEALIKVKEELDRG